MGTTPKLKSEDKESSSKPMAERCPLRMALRPAQQSAATARISKRTALSQSLVDTAARAANPRAKQLRDSKFGTLGLPMKQSALFDYFFFQFSGRSERTASPVFHNSLSCH